MNAAHRHYQGRGGVSPDVHIPDKLQTLLTQMMNSDFGKRPQSMEEVKKALTPLVTSFRNWSVFVYICFFSLSQGNLLANPLLRFYLLFVLALMLSYCIYTLMRAWRLAPDGLSAKAALLVIGKQFTDLLVPAAFLTGSVSLLYALLTQLNLWESHAFALCCYGILGTTFLLIWLKKKYELWRSQRPPAQPQQTLPPQQMQKRP